MGTPVNLLTSLGAEHPTYSVSLGQGFRQNLDFNQEHALENTNLECLSNT